MKYAHQGERRVGWGGLGGVGGGGRGSDNKLSGWSRRSRGRRGCGDGGIREGGQSRLDGGGDSMFMFLGLGGRVQKKILASRLDLQKERKKKRQ